MDLHKDIIDWITKMGYTGRIPDNFTSICNNSTRFIWEQLLQNVKPREEVDHIRKNIMLNRLKKKSLENQSDFPYKFQEIELLRRQLQLQNKIMTLKQEVERRREELDKVLQSSKIKVLVKNNLKKNIAENDEKKHLLDLKTEQLKGQISNTIDNIEQLVNVTPAVERKDSNTTSQVTKTLDKCIEKLQQTLKENLQKLNTVQKPIQSAIKIKKNHDTSSCAAYFSQIQKRNFEEITRSCVKQAPEKVFLTPAAQPKSRMNLFNKVPLVVGIDSNNISSDSSPYARPLMEGVLESNDVTSFDNLPSTSEDLVQRPQNRTRLNNRESLGILSDDCFTQVDNDFFLCNTTTNTFAASVCSSSSLNFTKPQISKLSNKSILTKPQTANMFNIYTSNTSSVSKELSDLLHGNNREFLYELLCNVMRSIQVKLNKTKPMECAISRSGQNRDDLTKLQYLHVQKEIQIRKQKKVMQDLNVKIGTEKSRVLASVKDLDKLLYVRNNLDININRVSLDASIRAINEEIDFSQSSQCSVGDLKVLLEGTVKVKSEIEIKLMEIKQMIEEIPKMERELSSLKENVVNHTWPIKMLQMDEKWMESLLGSLNVEEIQIFKEFPLAYQKRCTFTDPQTYIRDLYTDDFLHGVKIEEDDLQMLSEILQSPFQPPETVLLDLVKKRMKLDHLKRIFNQSPTSIHQQYVTKYSFEDLQKQESFLEFAIDRLKSIMTSSESYKTLSSGDVAKEIMEIYTEMPFKNFISFKRLVDGKEFKFYENKLNSFVVPQIPRL